MTLLAASLVHRVFFWGRWSALVAVGTLSLAAVTYGLVGATRRLAAGTDQEIRAQWRPVLVARRAQTQTAPPLLQIAIENVGRGPALDVWAEIDGVSVGARSRVVATGETTTFTFKKTLQPPDHLVGAVHCVDISGGACTTAFSVSRTPELRVTNLTTTADYSDPFLIRWWQRPFRKRIVARRLKEYRQPGTGAQGPDPA